MSNDIAIGSWPDYRCDPQLTGAARIESPLKNLTLSSTFSLGGGLQEVKLIPDGTGHMLLASGGGLQRIDSEGAYIWQTKPFGAHYIAAVADVDADGELEIVTSNAREVLILAAKSGEILWRESVALPLSYGTYATMFQVARLLPDRAGMQIVVPCFSHKEVLVFDPSTGARNTKLLHRLWMDDSYHPTTCIGDVNHDGIDEIVIARLGGVYVFDPISGRMLGETTWKSDTERRRNYGHFELCDIDNDGDLEAIILSDRVSRHIAVLDNDGIGNFVPLWDRFIQHIYPSDTTELRYTNNSVADVNGDGRPEITVSIFNATGDERWHTEVLDGATGKTLADYSDRYLRGVQDLDSDGNSELLLSRATHRIPERTAELWVEKFGNGSVWHRLHARFAERTVPTSLRKAQFKPDVFANDEAWFEEFHGSEQFIVFEPSDNNCESILSIEPAKGFTATTLGNPVERGSRVAAVVSDRLIISTARGEILSQPSSSPLLLTTGYHLTTEAHIAARPGPVATVCSTDGKDYVLVPTFSDEIVALEYVNGGLHELWRTRGRSRLGYDNVFHAVTLVQFGGKLCAVIVDDEGLDHARLSLYDMHGLRLRSYEFASMPSHSMGSRIGAYDWLSFEHSSGPALFVSFFRSPSMNSEYSLAINLGTGETLWELSHVGEGEYGRGVGAWGAASLHYSDGRPEAVLSAKDTLLRIDLESGTLVRTPQLLTTYTADEMKRRGIYHPQGLKTWSSIEDPFTAYGSVVLKDIDADGNDELISVSSFGGFGAIGDEMRARWWNIASFGDVVYRLPAICDIDRDGNLEFIQGHSTGIVRVYDAASGIVKCELDIAATSTDIISFDADNECACVTGTNDGRLLMLRIENNALVIQNSWDLGSSAGTPVIASLSNQPSILVVTGDGVLKVFAPNG